MGNLVEKGERKLLKFIIFAKQRYML